MLTFVCSFKIQYSLKLDNTGSIWANNKESASSVCANNEKCNTPLWAINIKLIFKNQTVFVNFPKAPSYI